MAYLSFTRNREDVLIIRALGHIQNGFFVDVGAYHPVTESNTYALYLRGWRGIAVEPQEGFGKFWSDSRPDDIFIAAAAGECSGELPFYEVLGRRYNATTAPSIAAMHTSEGQRVSTRVIRQVSLTALLNERRPSGDIHLLSVDVEGAEEAVLAGLDLSRFRPWLMVVESTLPNRFVHSFAAWEPRLLEYRYRFVYFDGVNRYYVAAERPELHDHFTYPPCVWDDFIDHRLHAAQEAARAAESELAVLKARLSAATEDLGQV